ncbi:MAG: 2-amino-4-hydroxy-6-hydroxymethyldihydropteridine diphosphokinase [Rickettsiales bacterium]|nr:2-amino-4-hydroxy-6-hydroxymethyldihydropteridine diphosphokinase [Rickettsiales bacterium]
MEVWIGLGSNLGDRFANLQAAAAWFVEADLELSPIFETAPWGLIDQPWFLNAVARLVWSQSPQQLLDACLACEAHLGRVRGVRNGPRIIDIDVLMFGDRIVRDSGLRIPHPGIAQRRSVLEPWAQMAPALLIPELDRTVADLRDAAVVRFTDQQVHPFGTSGSVKQPLDLEALGSHGVGQTELSAGS